MSAPAYFSYDPHRNLIIWTDPSSQAMNIARYPFRTDQTKQTDPLLLRTVYRNLADADFYTTATDITAIYPKIPVGIYLDKGSTSAFWSNTSECYGNGNCLGLEGNWECECKTGTGNCNPGSKQCPKGYAWFNKPSIDDVAHDAVVECSNMGICDHFTGECSCRFGFEV